MRSNIPNLPSTSEIARLARSPSALLESLADLDSGADQAEVPVGPRQATSAVTVPTHPTDVATGAMSWVTADFPDLERLPSDPGVAERPPVVSPQAISPCADVSAKAGFDASLN